MKTEKGRDHRNQTQNRFSSLVAPVLIRSRFSSPFFFSLSVSLRQSSCFKAADGLQHWHRPSVNKWRKRGSETCSRFFLSSDRPIEKKKNSTSSLHLLRDKKKKTQTLLLAPSPSPPRPSPPRPGPSRKQGEEPGRPRSGSSPEGASPPPPRPLLRVPLARRQEQEEQAPQRLLLPASRPPPPPPPRPLASDRPFSPRLSTNNTSREFSTTSTTK